MKFSDYTVETLAEELTQVPSYAAFERASELLYESRELLEPMKSVSEVYIQSLITSVRPIRKSKIGGLNVSVGHVDTQITVAEVSKLYTLIVFFGGHRNWNVITSNLLNLMDDHRVEFKVMSCDLLGALIAEFDIHKTGLTSLFQDNLKIYITFFNDSTHSIEHLITKSVNLMVALDNSLESMVDLLNSILLSLDKKFNRNDESSHLQILIDKIDQMVDILGTKILISFNRVNFLFNQMLVNPYLNEVKSPVIPRLLQLQTKILNLFHTADKQGQQLIYEYRFDMISCWSIVSKRSGIDTAEPRESLGKISQTLGISLEEI